MQFVAVMSSLGFWEGMWFWQGIWISNHIFCQEKIAPWIYLWLLLLFLLQKESLPSLGSSFLSFLSLSFCFSVFKIVSIWLLLSLTSSVSVQQIGKISVWLMSCSSELPLGIISCCSWQSLNGGFFSSKRTVAVPSSLLIDAILKSEIKHETFNLVKSGQIRI